MDTPGQRSPSSSDTTTYISGLDAADDALRVLNAGTSRLVQLLTDELVPLAPATLVDLEHTINELQAALPDLAHWQDTPSPANDDWLLEPPFTRVGIHLNSLDDLNDIENVERLRRSFDLLAPRSLALRKEAATLVVDALLHHLRSPKAGQERVR